MYDDLYCQNIYNFFNSNTLLGLNSPGTKEFGEMIEKLMADAKSGLGSDSSKLTEQLQSNLAVQMIERSIQSYLKDAYRNVEIKIYKAVLHLTNGQEQTHYFTCRLELGCGNIKGTGSVYDKLASIRNIVNASNEKNCKEAFSTQEKKGFAGGIKELAEDLKKRENSAKRSDKALPGKSKEAGKTNLSDSCK